VKNVRSEDEWGQVDDGGRNRIVEAKYGVVKGSRSSSLKD
jgi:hypothetical protein